MAAEESQESSTERYLAATHAMQSGVAMKMQYDNTEAAPKHLRVGMNSALVSNGALIELLVEKGLFTREEYLTRLADTMEEEAKSYRAWLANYLGTNVTLA